MKIHHIFLASLLLCSCSTTTPTQTTSSFPSPTPTASTQTQPESDAITIEYMDPLTIQSSSATVTLEKREVNDSTIDAMINGYITDRNSLNESDHDEFYHLISDYLDQTNTSVDTIMEYIDTTRSTAPTTDTFNNDDLAVIITTDETMIYVDHDDHIKITDPTTATILTMEGINDVLTQQVQAVLDCQTKVLDFVTTLSATTE